MSIKTKVDGSIKNVVDCRVKVDGEWKNGIEVLYKENGVWNRAWKAGFIAINYVFNITKSYVQHKEVFDNLTRGIKVKNIRAQAIGLDGTSVVGEYFSSEESFSSINMSLLGEGDAIPAAVSMTTYTNDPSNKYIEITASYQPQSVSRVILTIDRIDPVE